MLRTSPENKKRSVLQKAGLVGSLAGFGLIVHALYTIYNEPERINNKVDQAVPLLKNGISIEDAKAEVENFNNASKLAIRANQLPIAVSPEAAARLNLAFDKVDNQAKRNSEDLRITNEESLYPFSLLEAFGGLVVAGASIIAVDRKPKS